MTGAVLPATIAVAVVGQVIVVPTDLSKVRARLLGGDLVTLHRAQAVLRDRGRGADLDHGDWGLLDDLSRLVRCQPLRPIPDGEVSPWREARALVRLEAIRLARRLEDGALFDSHLSALVRPAAPYRVRSEAPGWELVRWPYAEERWPDEVVDPGVLRSDCVPSRTGQQRAKAVQQRRNAERQAVAALLPRLDRLWPRTAAKVAYRYAEAAVRVGAHFRVPAPWLGRLDDAFARAPAKTRIAGRFLLATLAGRAPNTTEPGLDETALITKILSDPERTPAEDSRARVRAVWLAGPDWPRVRRLTEDGPPPRPVDVAALVNARARALYALGARNDLKTLGRAFVRRTKLSFETTSFDAQTYDLLLRLALELAPGPALAWVREIGPTEPTRARDALADLGRRALVAERWNLAAALFDQLRLDAIRSRSGRGPRARADEAKWVGLRAQVAYARDNFSLFRGLLGELKDLAQRGPPRALATLVQDSIGPLTEDVARNPRRRRYASALLQASRAVAAVPSRWQRILHRYRPLLARLAGGAAAGSIPAAGPARPKIRAIGEVRLKRIPPRLPAPDHPTRTPVIRTFLVYQDAAGQWVEGAPWVR